MGKYTPGPWKVVQPKDVGLHHMPIFIEGETREDDTICAMGAGIVHYANAETNARLIAAAPDLLEAAKAMEQVLELYNNKEESLKAVMLRLGMLKQAITKASGGDS